MPPRPRFVTFEGIDGSGKSTQARRLAATLRDAGTPVTLTREPGGTPGAEAIRRLLVEGAADRWSAETEILLFTAARRDHVEKTIAPALDRGETVICDRFVDSTRIYQGAVRSALADLVDRLHAEVVALDPDVTLILDADPGIALARAGGPSEDRFESMGLPLQTRVRAAFLDLAAARPGRCRVIDGRGDPDAVAAAVRDELGAIA